MPDLEPTPDASPAPTVSPFELLSVLWRRKLVVLAVVIVSVVVSVALSVRQHKQYSSSAQLLFRDPGFAQALFGGNGLFTNGTEEPQRTTQTNIDVVTSLNVGTQAAQLLKTHEAVTSLVESIQVTPNANADIATIKATRSSPSEAAAVANAFAEAYVIYRRQSDRAKVAQAEELVNQSIATTTSAGELAKLQESQRQLGVLRALQTGNAEVIQRAQPNGTPVSPKPKRDAILGLVIGLLLGAGLGLVVDFLDRRLKKIEDFERILPDYPVIASVPHAPTAARALQLAGPAAESYRMLREGLRFVDPSGHARCFIVTSAEESEGKSTVAVNLASSVAAVGRRVVLVEADMHRPMASKLLGVAAGALGVSDLLVADAGVDVADFLVPVESQPGLHVLPSGTHPPNAADLLAAGRMDEVLLRLQEITDVVVIDSPPLLPVADTRVLLRLDTVNGVILVGRAGVSRRDRARAAARVLAQSGRRVFGLVITDVRSSQGSSYYYYSEDREPPASPRTPTPPKGRVSSPA